MRFLGAMSHTMQDTFAKSHAFRGEASWGQTERLDANGNPLPVDITDADDVLMGVNPILQNADFTKQDETKHHVGDVLSGIYDEKEVDAKDPNANNTERVEATAGARQAGRVTSHILYNAKNGTDNMDEFFEKLLAVDPSIERKGTTNRQLLDDYNNSTTTRKKHKNADRIISRAYQVPGSGRAFREKELSEEYTGGDQLITQHLNSYTGKIKNMERGEGGDLSPNRMRDAHGRADELYSQFANIRDAINRSRHVHRGQGRIPHSLRKQLLDDCYEIYKSIGTLVGKDRSYKWMHKEIRRFLTGPAIKEVQSKANEDDRRQ
jgi:hypothetical protein